ncbi:MAG TPA: T9SS type A sorting domain-containing protein, partial [bacterium]
LYILDISNPLAPDMIHEEALTLSLLSINVFNNLAYLGAGSQFLLIMNISNANDPYLVSQTPLYGYVNDVSVVGNYGYAACEGDGLVTLDLSDPSDPDILALLPFSQIFQVEVAGQVAYLLGYNGELRTVDISDPVNPILLGSLTLPDNGLDLKVVGDNAYIAGSSAGLRVVNLSNPAQPLEVGYYELEDEALGLAISGDYAYMAAGNYFVVLDHSMASPVEGNAPLIVPNAYRLWPPYPNPFNAQTKLIFDLPKAGEVHLIVYDIQGKISSTLMNGPAPAGRHEVVFDGRDFSSGIYLAKMEADGYSGALKLLLVK